MRKQPVLPKHKIRKQAKHKTELINIVLNVILSQFIRISVFIRGEK